MWHRATRELFDYWNLLRGQRLAPDRADIDLVTIRGLMADMFMLDVDPAHLFPFVLSGTRVNALACTEQNGRSFLNLWAEPERRTIAALLLTVVDAACPLMIAANARPEGWQDHKIEILLLPLANNRRHRGGDGTPRSGLDRARVLGLIAPTAVPSWLGLLPVENLALLSVEAVHEAAEPVRLDVANALPPGLGFAPSNETGGGVKNIRHLRVFQGGRQIS